MPAVLPNRSDTQRSATTAPAAQKQEQGRNVTPSISRNADTVRDANQADQGFSSLYIPRADPPASQEIRAYQFGVEAQTVPLAAKEAGNDKGNTARRFMAIQKDTPQGTIYYLSSRDYDKVYPSYHNNHSMPSNEGWRGDSFLIPKLQIAIVRLPDRLTHQEPVIGRDGTLRLTPDEKRYIDALSLYQHTQARRSGEYQACYDFYRRNDPSQRRTGNPNQPPALRPDEINEQVAKHLLALHHGGKFSDPDLVQSLNDMQGKCKDEEFYSAISKASSFIGDESYIYRLLNLLEATPVSNSPAVKSPNSDPSHKAEQRQRIPHADARVRHAQAHKLDTASIETQRARLEPLTRRESVMAEITANSPISLGATTRLVIEDVKRAYLQASAREEGREFTLVSGAKITADLTVRYHSRTQESKTELPSYRATIWVADKQYELTQVPVYKTRMQRSPNDEAYVIVTGNVPMLYINDRPLTGKNEPDMVVTADGHVFTRQGVAHSNNGKDFQAVANVNGDPIAVGASDVLKQLWHMPYIPTAMDVVG